MAELVNRDGTAAGKPPDAVEVIEAPDSRPLPRASFPEDRTGGGREGWGLPRWAYPIALVISLAVLVHVLARLLTWLATQPRIAVLLRRTALTILDPDTRLASEAAIVVLGLALAVFARIGLPAGASQARAAFERFARRRGEAVVLAGLLPAALRLALLPVMPAPIPKVADEFAHLLVADTVASGRIANPPHKLWPHFETVYVLHQPTYASIYPLGQGLIMGAAKAIGLEPWYGVWLSVGLMCAALCWMLQGWMPPPWALLGALLAAIRVAIDSYWMNSYWGGAVAAIGGALAVGALPRAVRHQRVRDALIIALGVAILAHSRPFEGLLLSIPIGVALVLALFRVGGASRPGKLLQNRIRIGKAQAEGLCYERRDASRSATISASQLGWGSRNAAPKVGGNLKGRPHNGRFVLRVLVPLAGAGVVIAATVMYHNWRVTGDPRMLPYQLHQKVYGTPQNLRWGREVTDAPRAHVQKDIGDNFDWQRKLWRDQATWAGLAESVRGKLRRFWEFFIGTSLTIPLLAFGLTAKRARFLVFAGIFALLGVTILYPFFFPHYAAPFFGATVAVTMYGMRRLRAMRWRGRGVGRRWMPWVLGATVASAVAGATAWTMLIATGGPESTPRTRVEAELKARGGNHVVLVRYGENHLFHNSWIYNQADVDGAAVVWARDMGDEPNNDVLRYFKGREAWVAEVDEDPVSLIPYAQKDAPRIFSVVNAAGRSPYFKAGVTPGSMVTIYGRNLARGFNGEIPPDLFGGSKPPRLERTVVKFGERVAPVLAASNVRGSESVTVQAPPDLAGESVSVMVISGPETASVKLPVLRANPGIFGAILRQDDTVALPNNRARRGETVRMLVTGLGRDPGPVVVGVNHQGAPVHSAKRSPQAAGVEIVEFEIPADAPSGAEVPLSMAVMVDGKPVYSNNRSIPIE